MSTRLITVDWYPGATLFYAVYSMAGTTLQSRTAMEEIPAGSGCFVHSNSAWDDTWIGRIVFDDGVLFESMLAAEYADKATLNTAAAAAEAVQTLVQAGGSGVPLSAAALVEVRKANLLTGTMPAAALANVPKTGYALASDGLDAISTTTPSTPIATWTFGQRLAWMFRRFAGKAIKTSSTLTVYTDDGTTPISVQPISELGTTETQGEAADAT